MKRRDFISFVSASLAFLSASCKRPEHKVVPAVNPVEFAKPGSHVFFNTAFQLKNCAYGITIKTIDGKPIKIDGNFAHPTTNGAINPLIQSSLYSLYNPMRFFKPQIKKENKEIQEAVQIILDKLNRDLTTGRKIVFLIDEICSPSFLNLIKKLKEQNDSIIFVRFSPFKSNLSEINKKLFGIDLELVPDIDKAHLVVTVDADILGSHKLSPLYTKKLISRRRANVPEPKLLSIESNLTLTGINSDRRYSISPDELYNLLKVIYLNLTNHDYDWSKNQAVTNLSKYFEVGKEICEEIVKFGQNSVLIPGDNLPIQTAEIIMAINYELKNIGNGKIFNPNLYLPSGESYSEEEIQILSGDFSKDSKYTFVFLETNPFYSGNQIFKKGLSSILEEDLISISIYPDETYLKAGLKLPAVHYLEKWGDAQFYDGNFSIIQPIIKPLNENSISSEEFLLKFSQSLDSESQRYETYYDYLRDYYINTIKSREDWDSVLRNGYFSNNKTIFEKEVKFKGIELRRKAIEGNEIKTEFYLKVMPSTYFFDYFEPDNPFLLELPEPITKITWENAAFIGEKTAEKFKLSDGDIIEISSNGGSLEIPVFILKGIPERSISINSGYGRRIQNTKETFGVNPFELIDSLKQFFLSDTINVKIKKTNRRRDFSRSQTHFATNEDLAPKTSKFKNSIYPTYEYKGQKWGMLIDLSKCTGCQSCVIACQFENNIPCVGKTEIQKGRIMHWIRIDIYHPTNKENSYFFEPMLCQHCDNAPCESVCPVGATSHSPEGLNEMTYNRCIGARFCMVNCPYNVRKFNYQNYYEELQSPLENMLNPEITIRMRGIAEKCTFCVQRINDRRIGTKSQGHSFIPDGIMKTACEEACPSGAIVFGDLNDEKSMITKLKNGNIVFQKLEFLNTKPSVFYIAKHKSITKMI